MRSGCRHSRSSPWPMLDHDSVSPQASGEAVYPWAEMGVEQRGPVAHPARGMTRVSPRGLPLLRSATRPGCLESKEPLSRLDKAVEAKPYQNGSLALIKPEPIAFNNVVQINTWLRCSRPQKLVITRRPFRERGHKSASRASLERKGLLSTNQAHDADA